MLHQQQSKNRVICWAVIVFAMCGVLSGTAWGQTPVQDKQVKMITFFPVPYVAYNNIFINKKLDIGVASREDEGEAGYEVILGSQDCKGQARNALLTNNQDYLPSIWIKDMPIFLRNIPDKTNILTLDLKAPIQVNTILLGRKYDSEDKVQVQPASLKFSYLKLGDGKAWAGVDSLQTKQPDINVYMYESSGGSSSYHTTKLNFPECPSGKVARWEVHKFKNSMDERSYYVLVCPD